MNPGQEQLVLDHLKSVHYYAKRYRHRLCAGNSYSYDDLVSEGTIGLIKAALRFDPNKGFKFTTYAGHYIDGHLKQFVNGAVTMAKFSKYVVEAANKLVKYDLFAKEDQEIAETLGVGLDTVRQARNYWLYRQSKSLDEPIGDSDGEALTLGDGLVLKDEVDFDTELIVEDFLGTLQGQEKMIAHAMCQGLEQKTIAKSLKMSTTNVSLVFRQVLSKAKQYGNEEEPTMSKIDAMRRKISPEVLKELLLQNKTSTEIGKQFGFEKSDIEMLKQAYKLTKASLGVDPFTGFIDQESEETVMETTPETKEIKTAETQPQAVATNAPLPQWLENVLGQKGQIVIYAQNITINIGA